MTTKNAIEAAKITKELKNFTLDVENFAIPQGFATALIGENGAGKTTLLNILAGIRLDYKGEITYFGQYSDKQKENSGDIKNRIGYTGPGKYYLPQWTVKDIEEISKLMFDDFSADDFHRYCEELAIFSHGSIDMKKANSSFSDGMKMKLMLAGVMARKTDILLLDEPAAGMNNDECNELVEVLKKIHNELGFTVALIEHHIDFVMNLCNRLYVLNLGKILAEGTPEAVQNDPNVIKAYLGERRNGRGK